MTAPSPCPLRHLLQDGLVTTAFCCAIALALTLADHGRWDVRLTYSLAIGLTAWLVIDLGRFALAEGIGWPRGWRGALLAAAGSNCGPVLGSLVGDAYSGRAAPLWRSPWLSSAPVITCWQRWRRRSSCTAGRARSSWRCRPRRPSATRRRRA